MEAILRPIHEKNIDKFESEAMAATIELQKDLAAILGGGYSIEEMTLAIDGALDCVSMWNDSIHGDRSLSMYNSEIRVTNGVHSRISKCASNMYYLRTEFERLKGNEYYYDKKYCVPLQEEPLPPPSKGYFRQRSKKWGNHGPYLYCLEYKDKVFSSEEISKIIRMKDLWIGMYSWKEVYIRDNSGFYKIHTCIEVDFKESMTLMEVKTAYPGAKVYHGTKAHQFYEKYIKPGFGPVYTCKLMDDTRWLNEVYAGELTFLEAEPRHEID